MKLILFCGALVAGQMQMSQPQNIVRLPAHTSMIPLTDGGKTIQLLYAPSIVFLPKQPPQHAPEEGSWSVDVINLGPGDVAVNAESGFSVHLQPKQTVHIRAIGTTYTWQP